MALRLQQTQIEIVRRHGSADYPNECCGILLGRVNDAYKDVTEVVPLKNLRLDPARAQKLLPLEAPGRESERNRFLIDPLEQLRVEKEARVRKLDVVGCICQSRTIRSSTEINLQYFIHCSTIPGDGIFLRIGFQG